MKWKLPNFAVPGWLFLAAMVVYHELMLHLWVAETVRLDFLATILLFAGGYGLAAGLLVSLIPSGKWKKAAVVTLGLLLSVIWLTEYFVYDAYQVFMTVDTILNGADGVAEDYFSIVVSLLASNWWRIAMMLLPTVLYGLLCRPEKAGWKIRTALALAAVILCLAGFFTAKSVGGTSQFSTSYEFGSAVRSLGLNTALVLETTRGPADGQVPQLVAPPPIPIPQETVPAEEPDAPIQEEPEVVYGDQVMEGVDFAQLAETAGSGVIGNLYQYIDSQTPAKKNQYTGIFAGKNLVLITAEAFALEVIDPELTPTLYRLANKGIKFTDFYQPAWGASTTSGEFSILMGLMPTTGGSCMQEANQQKMFLTMGHQLAKLGYKSLCYHNNSADFYHRDTTHLKLGYEDYIAIGTGLEITSEWPRSDREMVEVSLDDFIGQQPFSVYYMTVSGHSPYTDQNAQSKRHHERTAHLDHSEVVQKYLASQLELEDALTVLVERLEEEGILNDTVIALASDHYPYGLTKSNTWKNTTDHLAELYGVERYDYFTRDHNGLIIWSGCIEDLSLQVDTPVSSLDILPTLSNLFGVEYDSRLLVGRDVFSDQMPLVFWPHYSWKTDKGTYDRTNFTFTPAEGVTVDDGYVEAVNALVASRVSYCRSVSNLNFFGHLAKQLEE